MKKLLAVLLSLSLVVSGIVFTAPKDVSADGEYEKLRGNKLDSGETLSLFNKICFESSYLSNSNVFFVGFDSMTKQGVEVVCNVCKNSRFTYLGVVAPIDQDNKRIYDTSFLDGIIKMCKENKIEAEFRNEDLKFENDEANIVLNNVFSRKNVFSGNGFINIYRASSVTDEIDAVIKSINYLLKTEDIDFNDVAVCAPSAYHGLIVSKLNNIGVPTYQDEKNKLINFEPVKLILSILKYAQTGATEFFTQIVSNDFFGIKKEQSEKLINFIYQYLSVETILKYEKNLDEDLVAILKQILTYRIKNINESVEGYINFVNSIIDKLEIFGKIEDFCERVNETGEIQLQKEYKQLSQKITGLLCECEEVLGEEILSFENFIELLETSFSNSTISGVPCGVSEVFVGDYKSFYGDVKYLFTLGLNEGVTPDILSDCGLITDKEILSETIKAKIEPTTAIINKRNKFKTLDVILSPTKKSYLFYHMVEDDGKNLQPAEIITELKYLLQINDINVDGLKYYDRNMLGINKICYNAVDNYNANINLRNIDNSMVAPIIKAALISDGGLFVLQKNRDNFSDYKNLFFKNNKASVSLVEKYNSCPHSAFLANGLQIKKLKKKTVEANIIGTFIHKIAEMFVKENMLKLGTLSEEEIGVTVNKLCNLTVDDEDFYALKLSENVFLFKLICDECVRFCAFLNYEQSVSKFKPKYVEKYFGNNSQFSGIKVEVDGEEYLISGIVDRIDTNGDYFRIIDYKTGATNITKGKEKLYYGQKVQLFVYAEAIKRNVNKKLFGAFYLPIRNVFTKDNKAQFSLCGFFENSVALVRDCDNNLGTNNKSDIIGVSLNKPNESGELVLKKKVNQLSEKELEAFCSYAIEIVKKSIKNMQEGYIAYSPFSNKCESCEFNEICKYSEDESLRRVEGFLISNENFGEILNV